MHDEFVIFPTCHLRISSRILRTIFQQLVQTVCAEVKSRPMKRLRNAVKTSHPAWDRRYRDWPFVLTGDNMWKRRLGYQIRYFAKNFWNASCSMVTLPTALSFARPAFCFSRSFRRLLRSLACNLARTSLRNGLMVARATTLLPAAAARC